MPLDGFTDWLRAVERDLDPVCQLRHWMGHEPNEWQVETFTTPSPEVALRVGRQSGKTSVLAARAVKELHIPDSLTLCIAPAERQAKIIAREIGQQLRHTELTITRSTLTELEMSNGARCIALPSTSDTIRGFPSVSLICLDECAFLADDENLISSIVPMLTTSGQIYFSSTPAGRNGYFAKLFLEAKSDDGIHRIVVRGTDIPRLANKVARMRRTLSEVKFRQEILVELLSQGTAFFPMSLIEKATSDKQAIQLSI